MYLLYGANSSPSFGITTPRYLLGNISPYIVLIFQLGILFLLLDSRRRNIRDRIDEILKTKPVTNFEYLVGRVLSASFLLWIFTVFIVLTLHSIGLINDWAGFHFSEPFQFHSLLNLLLLDAPVTFIVSCSVVVLLTNALRLRMVVIVFGCALLAAWAFVVSESPYSFLAIVSASSNDSLFISQLSPQFASLTTIGVRITSLMFAGALLMFAASFVQIDGTSFKLKSALGIGLLVLSGVLYGSITWSVVKHYYADPAKWREVHWSHASTENIDILEIGGLVQINPKASLLIDLELLLKAEDSETFTFTFNPAMKINDIFLNDKRAEYFFKHGLLTVEEGDISTSDETYRMRIIAKGVPDPRFGYFNSAIDYLTDPDVPTRAVALLGKDGSIYEKNYVALMSGVHWYPTSGPLGEVAKSVQQGKDFFKVDLTVDLAAKNWHLVGQAQS